MIQIINTFDSKLTQRLYLSDSLYSNVNKEDSFFFDSHLIKGIFTKTGISCRDPTKEYTLHNNLGILTAVNYI